MKTTLLDAAVSYWEDGFSIIPLDPDTGEGKDKGKIPMIDWTPYQTRMPTKDEVISWWTQKPTANIAIVTGKLSNICVIDTDTFDAFEFIKTITETEPNVKTPRGGYHFYFAYQEGVRNKQNLYNGVDVRGEGGYIVAPPSKAGENGNLYELINDDITYARSSALPEKIYKDIIQSSIYIAKIVPPGSDTSNNLQQNLTKSNIGFFEGQRDETIFHIATCLLKGRMPIENIRKTLNFIAENCSPPFPERDVEAKIKSAKKRISGKEINLTQEIREILDLTKANINITELSQNLTSSNIPFERKNLYVIMGRLVDEGIVERISNKTGTYRVVDRNLRRIDLKDKTDLLGEMNIKFPLHVHEFIRVMPKTVYVIAGETDSGKSAYLMNFAQVNVKRYPVHYFSSEMGKEEFLDRLKYDWVTAEDDPNMNFYERSDDFDDVIFPDAINIIDYIKIFDNFYLMAEKIERMGKKLNNGLVFIALQKPKGRDEGLGGERTKDLARLYLSMSQNKLKISKAKNWRDPTINPNGLATQFKLRNGYKFYQVGQWQKED